jgi:O-6-methylguanine DNA methyltransferase
MKKKLTYFQEKVYAELKKVPAGSVITYQGLAARVGMPKASRAVGRAMATNPYIVVVPCHRVVLSTGKLGNYSGGEGVKTKRELLISEGVRFLSEDVVDPACYAR